MFIEGKQYKVNEITKCWNWTGSRNPKGYGTVTYNGKTQKAHRLAMFFWRNFDLNSELWVLHKCDNAICINPEHLYLGTVIDNNADLRASGQARGRFSGMTHCLHGHEFTPENTTVRINGSRQCKECKIAWGRTRATKYTKQASRDRFDMERMHPELIKKIEPPSPEKIEEFRRKMKLQEETS